jgi:hypothetical protein
MRRVHTSYDVAASLLFLVFTVLSEKVPELFTWLEADGVSGRDFHLDTGFRIASDSLFALLDLENAEAAKLDALAAREGISQSFDNRVDGLSRFDPRDIGCLGDLVDDVRLDHGSSAKMLSIR